jgi:hypothetical protein
MLNFTSNCFAHGCGTVIPEGMLMCPRHWKKVSLPVGATVYRTLNDWQNQGPLGPYLIAREQARLEVAFLEGFPDSTLRLIEDEIAWLKGLEVNA